MNTHIRPATTEDYVALLPIAYESQEQHAEALPYIFQEGVYGLPEDYFRGKIAHEDSSVFVADVEGRVVGYVIVEMQQVSYLDILVERRVAYIADISVLKSYQGEGIGHLLFQECVVWGKARGADSLDLMVWNFNQRAITFYARHGMAPMSRNMSLPLKEV